MRGHRSHVGSMQASLDTRVARGTVAPPRGPGRGLAVTTAQETEAERCTLETGCSAAPQCWRGPRAPTGVRLRRPWGAAAGAQPRQAVGPRLLREATVTETEIHSARVILTLEENCNKFLTRNCIWQESARTPVLIIHHF